MATVLFSPTGEKYEATTPAEATRLRSRGYTSKKPTPKQVAAVTGSGSGS